jgi:hypothetical protein
MLCYRHSMTDFHHPLWRRAILLLLLGLLLPMQSSLAYARSLAMLTAPDSTYQSELVIALVLVNEMPPVTELDAHHHSSQDVEAGMNIDISSEHHHVSDAAKPCHSDSSTGNTNHDCAKCCLMGTAAPPSATVHTQSLVMARGVFNSSSYSFSGFIPDGLERPPRTQHA